MLGVILWTDQINARAIIWCDDHSGLAYLTESENPSIRSALSVGDIVKLDIAMNGQQRLAVNVERLAPSPGGSTLPDKLRTCAATQMILAKPDSNVVQLDRDVVRDEPHREASPRRAAPSFKSRPVQN